MLPRPLGLLPPGAIAFLILGVIVSASILIAASPQGFLPLPQYSASSGGRPTPLLSCCPSGAELCSMRSVEMDSVPRQDQRRRSPLESILDTTLPSTLSAL